MYQVNYYLNGVKCACQFHFDSLFGAIYKARAIYTEHGAPTDVMDLSTGEVHAIFNDNGNYFSSHCIDNLTGAMIIACFA